MVQKTQKWDSIDNELARTYFNPMERHQRPFGDQKKTTHHPFPLRKTAAILAALGAASLTFLLAINVMNGLKSSSLLNPRKNPRQKMPSAYTSSAPTLYGEKVFNDFESDKGGWEIPSWALDKQDHTQKSMEISSDISSRGEKSLRIDSDFFPGKWIASIAEMQRYLDLSNYDAIAVDVYLPPDSPQRGFRVKLIFTVGEDWKFVEMSRSVKLEPGKWTYLLASLKNNSKDWKWTKVDNAFKEDIRKISLRVEYEGKESYSGPVYIDNLRVGNLEKPEPDTLTLFNENS